MSDHTDEMEAQLARRAAGLDEPIEVIADPTAIVWGRSVTTTRVHQDRAETTTSVKHTAFFEITPDSQVDVLADYSKTIRFDPRRMSVDWTEGVLTRVYLSGPQRLKSGGISDKAIRHREYSTNWRTRTLDRDELPATLAASIAHYELSVAQDTAVEAGYR